MLKVEDWKIYDQIEVNVEKLKKEELKDMVYWLKQEIEDIQYNEDCKPKVDIEYTHPELNTEIAQRCYDEAIIEKDNRCDRLWRNIKKDIKETVIKLNDLCIELKELLCRSNDNEAELKEFSCRTNDNEGELTMYNVDGKSYIIEIDKDGLYSLEEFIN